MPQLPHRLAIASVETWEVALRVKAALIASGLSEEGIVILALSDIFAASIVPGGLVQLPLLQPRGHICCMAGSLAAKLSLKAHESQSLEEFLCRWLLPRTAKQIASHVENGNYAIGVQLTESENEEATCRILLANASSPLEVHDLVCGDCRDLRSLK